MSDTTRAEVEWLCGMFDGFKKSSHTDENGIPVHKLAATAMRNLLARCDAAEARIEAAVLASHLANIEKEKP